MAPGRILVMAGSCGRRGVWPTPRSSTALTGGFASRAAGRSASTWRARSTNRCITRAVRRSASPSSTGLGLERRLADASRIGVGDLAAQSFAAQTEHEAVLGLGVQIDADAVDLADRAASAAISVRLSSVEMRPARRSTILPAASTVAKLPRAAT